MFLMQRRFSDLITYDTETAPTLEAAMGNGGGNIPIIFSAVGIDCYNQTTTGDKSMSIRSKQADNDHIPCVIVSDVYSLDEKMGQTYIHKEMANTLAARDYKQPQLVYYCIEGNGSRPSHRGNGYIESDKMYTLNTTEVHGVAIHEDIN